MTNKGIDMLMDILITLIAGWVFGILTMALVGGCGEKRERTVLMPAGEKARPGEKARRDYEPREEHVTSAARRLFDAIRQVESGGDDRALGDGERSKGPYQCGRLAWADGGGDPDDYDRLVWNRAACERVMVGYWRRYGATTDEARCRLWNGGPRWREKPATAEYWRRVKARMQCGF